MKEPKLFGPLSYTGFFFLGMAALGKRPEGVPREDSDRAKNRLALIGSGLIAAELVRYYQQSSKEDTQ